MSKSGEPPAYQALDPHANYNTNGGNDSNAQPGQGAYPNAQYPGAPASFGNLPGGGIPPGPPTGGQAQPPPGSGSGLRPGGYAQQPMGFAPSSRPGSQAQSSAAFAPPPANNYAHPPAGFAPGPFAGANMNAATTPLPGVTGGFNSQAPQAPGAPGGDPGAGGFGPGSYGGIGGHGAGFAGRGGRGGYGGRGGRGGQAGSTFSTFGRTDHLGMQDQNQEFEDSMNDGLQSFSAPAFGNAVEIADIHGPPDPDPWRSYEGIHDIFTISQVALPPEAHDGMWGYYNGIMQAVGSPLGVVFNFRPPRVQGLNRIADHRRGVFYYVAVKRIMYDGPRW